MQWQRIPTYDSLLAGLLFQVLFRGHINPLNPSTRDSIINLQKCN